VSAALQRARRAAAERMPVRSQQATLRSIGDERLREAVERYVRAWESDDVAAIVAMLTDDATFSMPPRPTWHSGRRAVAAFLAAVPLSGGRRWRHVPVRANGQPALALYASREGNASYVADAIIVLSFESSARIADVTAFKETATFARFGLSSELTRREPR
jgi:RNA polymerase sigma-70 factor, ECF subfamily